MNLSRNRKGNQPHIVVVTAEPLPGRLKSIALSTGDIDCVYHIALDELISTVETLAREAKLAYTAALEQYNLLKPQFDLIESSRQEISRLRRAKIALNADWRPGKKSASKTEKSAYEARLKTIRDSEAAARDRRKALSEGFDEKQFNALSRALNEAQKQDEQWNGPDGEKKALDKMVLGNRLRDIADLPLDLAV